MFERVLQVKGRSRWRAALAALAAGALLIGLVGATLVVPRLASTEARVDAWEDCTNPFLLIANDQCSSADPAKVLARLHEDHSRASVMTSGLLGVGALSLLSLLALAWRARLGRGLSAGNTDVDEIPSDTLSSVELLVARAGSIEICHPDHMTGTIDRREVAGPYRGADGNLLNAAEPSRRGPVIRLRSGDRLRATIGDLALDVEALDGAAA